MLRIASRSPIPARSPEGLHSADRRPQGLSLALVFGLLAGPLNRAAFGRDVFDFNYDDSGACDTRHFIIALDVSRDSCRSAAFKSRSTASCAT